MTHSDAVKLLELVAKRGFESEPIEHWLNKEETAQYCSFSVHEKQELRRFLGENQHLSRIGRHPLPSFGNEPTSYTLSLLGRISYAMDGKHISPEYVSGLGGELHESLAIHSAMWEVAELNRMESK